MGGEAAGKEPALHQGPDGREQVLRADFLSLGIGSSLVGDGHFVQPQVPQGQFRGQLRLERESVGRQRNRPQDVGAHQFVTGLHVGQVDVVEHVAQRGQKPVAQRVPEVQHPAVLSGQKPGAEDGVGNPRQHRAQQRGVVVGVVFQIGVLDQSQVSGHHPNRRAHGGRLALVALVQHVLDALIAAGQLGDQFAAAIGRAVVDDD